MNPVVGGGGGRGGGEGERGLFCTSSFGLGKTGEVDVKAAVPLR